MLLNKIKKMLFGDVLKQDGLMTTLARVTKRPAIYFDIEVTDCCNLKCKACGSFAPLAKKTFVDKNEIKRDLERLSELSSGVCHHINIMGGEPLLHPEIVDIISITRECFPIGSIFLVTNGILLMKQDELFWSVCRDKDIVIAPTHYPINIDYNKIRNKVVEEKCRYQCFGTPAKYWLFTGISEKTNANEAKRFLECPNANNCSVLKEGKIYMCPKPAKINLVNDAFGTNFKVTEKDFVDIYKVKSIDEILDFLSKPIPFCRYCNEWEKTEWGVSKKEKNEWVRD